MTLPETGRFVRVRSRRWLVEEVDPSPGEETRVRLACVDDDAAGTKMDVLWERELDAALLGAEGFGAKPIARLDEPVQLQAYLDTLRWSAVTSTQADLFQSPFRAGISLKAHQLEPLRRALLLPRANLLVADDVGLGKTIEAGLVLSELLLRQRVRRAVVACPPSVVLQWKDELYARFGLFFRVIDRGYVLRVRRERGHAANPWAAHPFAIVSHALLRDETYVGPLRALLASEGAAGTVLILDEAHHAAPASGGKYAVDSRFTRMVRDIAPLFEHRLFLSATPHNGHSNSFSALLELIDPARFVRGIPPAPEDRRAVVVRRLKRDVRDALPDEFPKRSVPQHTITGLPPNAPELALSRLLDRYRELREARLASLPKHQQAAAGLVLVSLQKRLLSSVFAFERTLRVHRRAVDAARARAWSSGGTSPAAAPAPLQLAFLLEPPDMDDERAGETEEALRESEDAAVAAATHADPTAPTDAEIALLDEMKQIASAAKDQPDPRVVRLVHWIRENLCPDVPPLGDRAAPAPKAWNDRRLLVFTEYADTKDYLITQLRAALREPERDRSRLRAFHGGIDDETREALKDAFNADPSEEPLRILVCTDAAREGVNLQAHCADLFHFDLPWNPARVEQRNGRIDRTLQRAKEVSCHYFLLPERPEDKVLETMVKKTITIEKELGSAGAVVEGKLAVLLEGGIALGRVGDLVNAILKLGDDPERIAARRADMGEDASKQDLARSLPELRELLDRSRERIDFAPERLRSALDAALSILRAPLLEPIEPPADASQGKGRLPLFEFPDLVAATGDPSFWPLLDLLRERREKGEPLWDWRRRAGLRPVIFQDAGKVASGLVHLHLAHPLVQRLLGRFSAQGFVHHDLSRAGVLSVPPHLMTKPHLLLFGRLALYGEGASRLHDELVTVAAEIPSTGLVPADDARTLQIAREAFALPQTVPDEAWAKKNVLAHIPDWLAGLKPALEKKLKERETAARKQLTSRGKAEATALRKVIAEQGKRLEKRRAEVKKQFADGPQLTLDFDARERDQIIADLAHWDRRLAELGPRADEEAALVEAAYAVRSGRREPVALIYLRPESG